MSPEHIAYLYVYYLEPLFKVLLWVALLVVVLYGINMLTDGKRKSEIINSLFNLIINVLKGVLVYGGKAALWSAKMLLKITTILIDTIRDFFTSKI